MYVNLFVKTARPSAVNSSPRDCKAFIPPRAVVVAEPRQPRRPNLPTCGLTCPDGGLGGPQTAVDLEAAVVWPHVPT